MTADVFATEDTIQVDALAEIICEKEDHAYREAYEKQNGGFADEVNVVKEAAIRKPVTKMTTLKLGVDFEVTVLNPDDKIEEGFDKKSGKKYYTLYYEG